MAKRYIVRGGRVGVPGGWKRRMVQHYSGGGGQRKAQETELTSPRQRRDGGLTDFWVAMV